MGRAHRRAGPTAARCVSLRPVSAVPGGGPKSSPPRPPGLLGEHERRRCNDDGRHAARCTWSHAVCQRSGFRVCVCPWCLAVDSLPIWSAGQSRHSIGRSSTHYGGQYRAGLPSLRLSMALRLQTKTITPPHLAQPVSTACNLCKGKRETPSNCSRRAKGSLGSSISACIAKTLASAVSPVRAPGLSSPRRSFIFARSGRHKHWYKRSAGGIAAMPSLCHAVRPPSGHAGGPGSERPRTPRLRPDRLFTHGPAGWPGPWPEPGVWRRPETRRPRLRQDRLQRACRGLRACPRESMVGGPRGALRRCALVAGGLQLRQVVAEL